MLLETHLQVFLSGHSFEEVAAAFYVSGFCGHTLSLQLAIA